MSAQMSMPMMFAPSRARRTAWLRPCPRATPVMKATLPSTEPTVRALTSSRVIGLKSDEGNRVTPLHSNMVTVSAKVAGKPAAC